MCGRFGQFTPVEEVARQFKLDETARLTPRYNVAPTQPAAVIRADPENGTRRLALLRWGLIPAWSREPPKAVLINARAETVFEKPAFRSIIKRKRGLIPADGFYEWKKDGRRKQPYFIRLPKGRLMALAGLWDQWPGPDGLIESFTILTTTANRLMQTLHERMPVIIPASLQEKWLDPEMTLREDIQEMLAPWPDDSLELLPVSDHVNKAGHEGPECILPVEEKQPSLL